VSRQLLFSLSCSHFLSALQPLSRSLYWASGFSHAIFIQSMHFTLIALRLSAERVGAYAFRLCVIFSASLSHASCYFARLCSDSRNCVKPGIRRFFCRFWSGQRGIGSQTRLFSSKWSSSLLLGLPYRRFGRPALFVFWKGNLDSCLSLSAAFAHNKRIYPQATIVHTHTKPPQWLFFILIDILIIKLKLNWVKLNGMSARVRRFMCAIFWCNWTRAAMHMLTSHEMMQNAREFVMATRLLWGHRHDHSSAMEKMWEPQLTL